MKKLLCLIKTLFTVLLYLHPLKSYDHLNSEKYQLRYRCFEILVYLINMQMSIWLCYCRYSF